MQRIKCTTFGLLILSIFVFTLAKDFPKVKYGKSFQIVLNTSTTGANVREDISDFPVLIKLNKKTLDIDVIKKDVAGEISFSTSDGSFLSYKIQEWDKKNKYAEIWVIVPKIYGNNNSQYITMLWSKNKDSITDKKQKDRIKDKESHEKDITDSEDFDNSLFKTSYDSYGEWSSNDDLGFKIVNNKVGL